MTKSKKPFSKAAIRMRYVSGIPRKPLLAGVVLVHNHVRPQRELGLNGFRAWTQPLNERLEVCPCDWAGRDLRGLTHYRVKTLAQEGLAARVIAARKKSR